MTVTFTWTLVQQHWEPPPPSPEVSFSCARSTYSPGSVNVAVVVAFPSALAISGLALPKLTGPGPRNLLQVSESGGKRKAAGPSSVCASSLAHTVRVTGSDTAVA